MAQRLKELLVSPGSDGGGIEKKLAKYALAGSAILGMPFAAQASGIQYSGLLNQPITDGNTFTVFLPIGGSSASFTIAASSSPGVQSITVTGTNTNFVDDASNNPLALNFGDLITTANATGPGGTLASADPSQPFKTYTGNWPFGGSSPAYLGLDFTSSGDVYTAWAQIVASAGSEGTLESATLVDYAYQTTPDVSIPAGAGAPEPSSIALFALGAAGIAVLRRRRKAAN
jgi:hypothetical protein